METTFSEAKIQSFNPLNEKHEEVQKMITFLERNPKLNTKLLTQCKEIYSYFLSLQKDKKPLPAEECWTIAQLRATPQRSQDQKDLLRKLLMQRLNLQN